MSQVKAWLAAGEAEPGALVIGADTIVVLDASRSTGSAVRFRLVCLAVPGAGIGGVAGMSADIQ
jgi:hypothetical protein